MSPRKSINKISFCWLASIRQNEPFTIDTQREERVKTGPQTIFFSKIKNKKKEITEKLRVAERQKDRKTKRQKDKKTNKQKDKKTKKTKRQKDE